MKKLLLILGLCCAILPVNAQEQQNNTQFPQDSRSLQDSHHNLIGYMRGSTLYDKDNNIIFQYKGEANRQVIYKSGKLVGYLYGDEIRDVNDKTLGSVVHNSDYSITIQDAQHSSVGYILTNGTVQDNIRTTIGYQIMTEPVWAAGYFFFFKN